MTSSRLENDGYRNNSNRIVKASGNKLGLDDVALILRHLGADTPNLINLDIAITNLQRIIRLDGGSFFRGLDKVIEKSQTVDQEQNGILKTFGSSRHNATFLLNNKQFSQNKGYGIFSGIPLPITEKLTLQVDKENPTYHPILSAALLIVVIQLQQNYSKEPPKGLKTLCENIKYLVSDQQSKEEIASLIQKYIESLNGQNNSISVFKLLGYLEEIKSSFRKKTDLKSPVMDLIAKILKESALLDECITLPSGKQITDVIDEEDERGSDLVPPNIEEDPEPSVKILKKPNPEGDDFEGLSKEKSNPFLRTVGVHDSESKAQNLLHVNETLLPSEIWIVENFIFQESNEDIELDKLKLVLALMLYYSIPIKALDFVLIGSPRADYSIDECLWHIVIDITSDIVFLPTPMQQLNVENEALIDHEHLSLPLEKKIKSLLVSISAGSLAFRLNTLVTQEVIEAAKSFKNLDGFRQYRITAGKVSRAFCDNVFWHCQDQVKTAYLQGGAYDFIHMGCFYTQFDTDGLVELYKKVSSSIFRFHQLPEVAIPDKPIGSLRKPKAEDIRKFLDKKHSALVELSQTVKTNEQLWNFHSQLALYTVTLLCIETSHRPHYDPFYSVTNFIDDNLVQITEKEVMAGFEGRLAIVEDIVASQVQIYLKHLSYWARALSLDGVNKTSRMLSQLANGSMSLPKGIPLFFIVENGEVVSIGEKLLDEYFNSEEGISLECNFFRHFFSSEMSRLEVPRISIADQMGHNSKGLELGSRSRFNSILADKQQLLPYIQKLASSLQLKSIPKLPFAKYQSLNLKELKSSKKLLGPFKRARERKVRLNAENILAIDQLLESKNFKPHSQKLFISLELQSLHLTILKKHAFQKSSKVLHAYYQAKKSALSWVIERSASLAKSPFGKRYGVDYHAGKRVCGKIHSLVSSALDSSGDFDNRERRVLLSLSAIASGQIVHNEHILAIANIPLKPEIDIKLASSLELTASDNHKLWILNSSSSAIFKLIDEPVLNSITIDFIEEFLRGSGLPKLSYLIRSVNAFLTLYRPNALSYFIQEKESQSSTDLKGIAKLLGDFSEVNRLQCLSQNLNNLQVSSLPGQRSAKQESSEFIKSLNSLLRQAKDNKFGYSKTLSEVEGQCLSGDSQLNLNSAQILLVDWVKLALTDKWYYVSTVSQYFQDVYKFIEKHFSNILLEDLDEELIIEDLYPSILKEMMVYYEQKDSEIPTAALASFHLSLEQLRDIDSIKFIGGAGIKLSSLQNQLITEDEYQASQKAIINSTTLDELSKKHLSITLLMYRRLGLRKSEVFKIKVKDICLNSKTIHIHGIKYDRQKSTRGNRLLPYSSLLKESEIELFEEFVLNHTLEQKSEKRQLVFHHQMQCFDKSVVIQKVTTLIQSVLRAVTANQGLTIKSLRKTFASEVFLNLTISENFDALLKHFCLNRLHLESEIQNAFNQKHPFNLFWLLASWMGHSSPLTTFKHYILTQEFIVHLWSEERLQEEIGYIKYLRFLGSEQNLSNSAYKNLNRTKAYKYATLYSKFLTEFTPEKLKAKPCDTGELLPVETSRIELDKALTLYRNRFAVEDIDKALSLLPSTTINLVRKAKSLISGDSTLSDQLFCGYLMKLSAFGFAEGKIISSRTSEIYKQTIKRMERLGANDKAQLKVLWQNQLAETFLNPCRFQIRTEDELEAFWAIYQKIECHAEFGGYLLVEINGYRHEGNEALKLNFQSDFIKVLDKRKITEKRLPVIDSFDLFLSTRSLTAKKISKSNLAFNAFIFWSVINF